MRDKHRIPIPLEVDGFARVTAPELLVKHRAATCGRGDIVRAIATLQERVEALERLVKESTDG